ncbi:MAG: SRPBCC domain-containing protein [Rhodocyclaceae bacterium]
MNTVAPAFAYLDGDFVVSRHFDAPRDMVWQAWSIAERLAQWWGPKGFSMRHARAEFRPGGMFHYGMATPNGQMMWGRFIYGEIEAPCSLEYTASFSDEQGGITRHPGIAVWPMEVFTRLTFNDERNGTIVTLRGKAVRCNATERAAFRSSYESMSQAFNATWNQLAAYLAKEQALQFSRR